MENEASGPNPISSLGAPMASPEAIPPVVDLRLVSQAELYSLAASTSTSSSRHRCNDDVAVPKIDRSVFNESAGSRKQTFSRLRLAPRNLSSPPKPPSSADHLLILQNLRRLFSTLTTPQQSLAPAPPPQAQLSAIDVRDRELLNARGVVVDLVALGEKKDPFGEELRRRTEGLTTEEGMLGFLYGLDGQWSSRRRRKKIVDAAGFGDHLPRWWRLSIGVKKKEGVPRLDCRRYVSPSGKQFKSCSDVAYYILSLRGDQDSREPRQINWPQNEYTTRVDKLTPQCAAGPLHQVDTTKGSSSSLSAAPASYIPSEHDKQGPVVISGMQEKAEFSDILQCHKCNLAFPDKDAHLQHHVAFHKRGPKKRKLDKAIEESVLPNEKKYGCQYSGHVGAHVRYEGLGGRALASEDSARKIIAPASSSTLPHALSEVDDSAKKNKEDFVTRAFTARSSDEMHVASQMPSCENDGAEHASTCKVVDDGNYANKVAQHEAGENFNICNTSVKASACANLLKFAEGLSISKSIDGQSIGSENAIDTAGQDSGVKNVINVEPSACFDTGSLHSVINDNSETSNMVEMSRDGHTHDFSLIHDNLEELVGNENRMFAKPNACLDVLLPSLTNIDKAASEAYVELDSAACTIISEIQDDSREDKVDTEIQVITIPGDGSSYGVEAYQDDVLAGKRVGDVSAEANVSASKLGRFFANYGVKDAAMHEGLPSYPEQEMNIECSATTTSGLEFVLGIKTFEDTMLTSQVGESSLQGMDKHNNEAESCVNRSRFGFFQVPVSAAIGSTHERDPLQLNLASMSSSWMDSSAGLPILDMMTDQCEVEPSVPRLKHGNMGFEAMEVGNIDSTDFALATGDEFRDIPELALGYPPKHHNGHNSSIQLDWNASSTKSARKPGFTSICVWCNREFNHEDTGINLQSDSLGFICPACKVKISG